MCNTTQRQGPAVSQDGRLPRAPRYSLCALHTYTCRVCMPYMIDAGAGRAYVNGLLLCMYALYNTCLTCIVFMTDVGAGRTHGNGCLIRHIPYMYALDNACLTCIVCMTDVGAGRTHGDGPHRAGQGVN